MIYAYIGAMLVAVVLIIFAVLAIAMLGKAVGYSIKKRTVALMEIYDEELEKRALDFQEKYAEWQEPASVEVKEVVSPAPIAYCRTNSDMQMVSRLADTQYRDGSTSEVYRQIRNGFRFTLDDALYRIPSEQRTKAEGAAHRVARELQADTICAMASLDPQQQYELLRDHGGADVNALLAEYTEKTTVFSCIGFYDYIHQRAAEETGGCTLYLAPGAAVGIIPGSMTVKTDPGICEGFLLEASGTVYDYSLQVREIS